MNENGEKRPWLAALLAVLYPGLGHLYLGLWGRALLWSATAAASVVLFISEAALVAARDGGLLAMVATLSASTVLALSLVTAVAALDAYYHALSGQSVSGTTCPSCGKEVDEDLEFCQWCTAELE